MIVKLLKFASELTIAHAKQTKNPQGQSARKFRSMNTGWKVSLPRVFARRYAASSNIHHNLVVVIARAVEVRPEGALSAQLAPVLRRQCRGVLAARPSEPQLREVSAEDSAFAAWPAMATRATVAEGHGLHKGA